MKKLFLIGLLYLTTTYLIAQDIPTPNESRILDTTLVLEYTDKAWDLSLQDPMGAQAYCLEALRIAQKIVFPKGEAIAYGQMAVNFDILGQKDSAFIYYFKALNIQESIGNYVGQASSLHNIGSLYQRFDNLEKALYYLEEGLEIERTLGDKKGIGLSLVNLAILYKNQERFDKALELYKEALSLFEALDYKDGIYMVYSNLANLYLKKNEYDLAEETALRILPLLKEQQNINLEVGVNGVLSDVYFQKKEYKKALQFAQKQLDIITEVNRKEQLADIYLKFAEIYKAMNSLSLAYEYARMYADTALYFSNQDFNAELAEMDTKYRTAEKDKKVNALELQQEKGKALLQEQEIELARSENIRNVFILGAVIFLLIAFTFYFRNKTSRAYNAVLEEKNQVISETLIEKELLFKELNHRVKNNLQLINSILELQTHYLEDAKLIGVIQDCNKRVKAVALVHQKLYANQQYDRFDVKNYLNDMMNELQAAFSHLNQDISLQIDSPSLILDIETIIPLGLIVNELTTNVFKYAFQKNQKGNLVIRLQKVEQKLVLTIQDNGQGIDVEKREEGFGYKIVNLLVRQLRGSILVENQGGTKITIALSKFKVYE